MRESELERWVKFFGKRMIELAFIAAWFLGVWSLNEFVVRRFPLEGVSLFMYYAFEGVFSITTLYDLLKLASGYDRKDAHQQPWWR